MASAGTSMSRRSRTGDRQVGSFTIEDEIGKGSFATVYRGKHKADGALVAIKSVNLSKLNKKLKDNLYCEIGILKGLHHPHIVALIDCRESPTHIHLVMEYCELGDLSYFIKKRDKLADHPATKDMVKKYAMPAAGGLNEVVVRHFLKQLASAMEFLRERDFIHRDVKPQNLLLLPSLEFTESNHQRPLIMTASQGPVLPMVGIRSLPILKLADFGFARSLPATSLAETLCGSPLYMAPEILRYEKYDAKADLWSIGTVLFEMVTGKPPFRATNHVELLRKIEQQEDNIKFPRDAVISSELKTLVRGLLKRTPADRMEFDRFFGHVVVVDPIPGLASEDQPTESLPQNKIAGEPGRKLSLTEHKRRSRLLEEIAAEDAAAQSAASREEPGPSAKPSRPREPVRHVSGTSPRIPVTHAAPKQQDRRPSIVSAATAPNVDTLQHARHYRETPIVPKARSRTTSVSDARSTEKLDGSLARAEAEQAVRDAREYVLVEKKAVEVNAFADEMAASPRMMPSARPSRGAQIMRRATTQGPPSSTSGAVSASPSRAMQIAQGRPRVDAVPARQNSYGKSHHTLSTTSAITKALHGASVRVFGVGWNPSLLTKGISPPQLYSPFPAYPTQTQTGLLGDGRMSAPHDEDSRAVAVIEESATRSDVVFGFAEVKYKQLFPMTPSMDNALGISDADRVSGSVEEGGLTVEAIVLLSEEALVLYVKALSLLAKSMDIAGAWWSRRNARGESQASQATRLDSTTNATAASRINAAVQWVRNRFNEVLEKAELVRLKLIDAQKRLPEDHPAHPTNHILSSRSAIGSSSAEGVILCSGVTAEKLIYDRAVEMSRSAAISEIANEDLPGCEISYITAIRMLEAVLDIDEDITPQRRRASSLKEESRDDAVDKEMVNGIALSDRKDMLRLIAMIRTRLATLRKKIAFQAQVQGATPPSPRLAHALQGRGSSSPVGVTPPR